MEATGSDQVAPQVEVEAQIDVKQVESVVESVVASADVAVEVQTVVETVEQVKEQVEQVKDKVEDITKEVEQVYLKLKAQFDGQTSLPVCVLKVMTEVEKMIPKQQKKQVAVAVIQKILPDVDAQAVVELIDAFITVAKAPGAVQSSTTDKQAKGCCICM